MKDRNLRLFNINLKLYDVAAPINSTTSVGLKDEMKVFYSDLLLDNAEAKLIHNQFAQTQSIPKNGGNTIEFRRWNPLPKATTPLKEGITPDGQEMSMSVITTQVKQYGAYVPLTDRVQIETIDPILVQVTKAQGQQSGSTLDTITREVIVAGSNVQYASGQVLARHLLTGGSAVAAENHYFDVEAILRAERFMEVQNAPKFDNYYVALIHPDVKFDLKHDPLWERASEYGEPEQLFTGEIGRVHGFRFVKSTESKVFHAEDLTLAKRNLTVASAVTGTKVVTVTEAIAAEDVAPLKGRKVIINSKLYTVVSATAAVAGSATITLSEAFTAGDIAAAAIIYPGEAGAKGRDVYGILCLGENAYATVGIDGENLKHIVKQIGSGGSEDPLDQRGSSGWKASTAAIRLQESFMLRIEVASTFESGKN